MNKPIFDIDAMCSILKRQGIESSEYTDCTILYSVTFEQLRSLFTEGYQTGLVELLPLQRQVAMLVRALQTAKHGITMWEIKQAATDALNDTQATAEAYDREHAAKVLEDAAYDAEQHIDGSDVRDEEENKFLAEFAKCCRHRANDFRATKVKE